MNKIDIFTITDKEIQGMTGEEFEYLVGELYKLQGYEVSTTAKTNDFGADLVLKNPTGNICVQTKRQTSNVGIKAVQEVYASMAKYGAYSGIVVTSSNFSAQAIELAKCCGISLINGSLLWKYIIDIQNKEFIYKNEKSLLERFDELVNSKKDFEQHIQELNNFEEKLKNLISEYENQNLQNNSKTSTIDKYYQLISQDYKVINDIKIEFLEDKEKLNKLISDYEDNEHILLNLTPKENELKDLNNLVNSLQNKIYCGIIIYIISLIGVFLWN